MWRLVTEKYTSERVFQNNRHGNCCRPSMNDTVTEGIAMINAFKTFRTYDRRSTLSGPSHARAHVASAPKPNVKFIPSFAAADLYR